MARNKAPKPSARILHRPCRFRSASAVAGKMSSSKGFRDTNALSRFGPPARDATPRPTIQQDRPAVRRLARSDHPRQVCRPRSRIRPRPALVAPVHGRGHPASLVLPVAPEPARTVGVPDLDRGRPLRIETEVRGTGRIVPAHVPPTWLDTVPGCLEAGIVEVEVADVAARVEAVEPGAVGQQAEVLGNREVLWEKVRDAKGRCRRQ